MAGSKHFYDAIKLPMGLFPLHISQTQFDGIEDILEACSEAKITDNRYIAYMLATVYHECAKTMIPVRENGKGAGYDYGKKLKRGGGAGKRIPYTTPDQIFYGRGYVQLTWYENYQQMGKLLGIDLLDNPDLALNPKYAAAIMIKGMTVGYFTGKKLSDYFNDKVTDWTNARKIINGLDVAERIAGYAQIFYHGLVY